MKVFLAHFRSVSFEAAVVQPFATTNAKGDPLFYCNFLETTRYS